MLEHDTNNEKKRNKAGMIKAARSTQQLFTMDYMIYVVGMVWQSVKRDISMVSDNGRFHPLFRSCKLEYINPHLVATFRNVSIHVSCKAKLILNFLIAVNAWPVISNYFCPKRTRKNALFQSFLLNFHKSFNACAWIVFNFWCEHHRTLFA